MQIEEDRAIRLYVSGKITEAQLDLQRKFITERLESLRAKVDDYRAREASGAKKRELTEAVLAWASNVGEGLDDLSPEQRKEVLRMVVEEVTVDRENNLDITLAVPIEEEGESVAIASQPSPRGREAQGSPARVADFDDPRWGARGPSSQSSPGGRRGRTARPRRRACGAPALSPSQREGGLRLPCEGGGLR